MGKDGGQATKTTQPSRICVDDGGMKRRDQRAYLCDMTNSEKKTFF
jgi:hypothetical protein